MTRRARSLLGITMAVSVLVAALWGWFLRAPPVHPPELLGKLYDDSMGVEGRQRSFTFYIPSTVQSGAPLILVLHGSSMDGKRMREATGYGFDVIADREGFIVAYPDGFGGHWNDCREVGAYEAKRRDIHDVAFLRELIDWFVTEHGISPDRVFATGFSNGGQMAYRLAYEMPDLVRAVAAIAASIPTPDNQTCLAAGQPVATMIINGTKDPLNPYSGGEVALFGVLFRRGTVESTLATATYWARLAGAAEPLQDRLPDADAGDGTGTVRWTWAGTGPPHVILFAVEAGGHTIPHPDLSFPRILGRTSHDFSAAEVIWSFFATQLATSEVKLFGG